MSLAAKQQNQPTNRTWETISEDQTLIYLVRHGQTSYNIERRFQGQLDVPLSEEGEEQARAVSAWLADQQLNFGALYSSDLKRALETARAIGERLGLVPQQVEALREIHVGEWQGLVSDEIEARFPGQLSMWRDQASGFRTPGGETTAEVQQRMFDWYVDAITRHRGQAIIVVSHGMALWSLVAGLNGWELSDLERTRQAKQGNTGVSVVLADHVNRQSRTILLNSLAHLESRTAAPNLVEPSSEGTAA